MQQQEWDKGTSLYSADDHVRLCALAFSFQLGPLGKGLI